jgi:hypothetical protein
MVSAVSYLLSGKTYWSSICFTYGSIFFTRIIFLSQRMLHTAIIMCYDRSGMLMELPAKVLALISRKLDLSRLNSSSKYKKFLM